MKLELQNESGDDLVCVQFTVSIVDGVDEAVEHSDEVVVDVSAEDLDDLPQHVVDNLRQDKMHKEDDGTVLRFKPQNL